MDNQALDITLEDVFDMIDDDSYHEYNTFNEPLEDENIHNTQAILHQAETQKELQRTKEASDTYSILNEREYGEDREIIENAIVHENDITNAVIEELDKDNVKPRQSLESQIITQEAKERDSFVLDSNELAELEQQHTQSLKMQELEKEKMEQRAKEVMEQINAQSKEYTEQKTIQATKETMQNINTQELGSTLSLQQEAKEGSKEVSQENYKETPQEFLKESNNESLQKKESHKEIAFQCNKEVNQEQEKIQQVQEMLANTPTQKEYLEEQDDKALDSKEFLEHNYPLMNDFINTSNQLDCMQEELQKAKEQEDAKNFDEDSYKRREKAIDDASEELEKALDNLTKIRSFADFIRALYILDAALFEMKQASKLPQENPLIKEMSEKMKKGEPMTKESALKALKAISASKNKIENYLKRRQQEKEIAKSLKSDITKYTMTQNNSTKKQLHHNIQKNFNVSLNYDTFEVRYPKLVNESKELLQTHQKEFAKESRKARSR
ncbi:hypothetical protein CQA53_05620 [Helicobacter didelphidarum]|uniref:Uncharacterized protein n=1 Tax=Helicobacter didelphidarum TaxID=2040648 RepID=A0A3D8IKJ5_9HELI|nr:hypothetical protein [Helicobacter didelphidarum]RDU65772.1 hypothetical protein CQA53_05620 [Helicobacter didelphidarum]